MQVKKQQLELGMEQQTGSKFGKEYIKDVYSYVYKVFTKTGQGPWLRGDSALGLPVQ